MAVYEKGVCGKSVRWWTCPLCDKRVIAVWVIAVYPDLAVDLTQRHLWTHYEDESEDDVNDAIDDLWRCCVHGESVGEILAETVLSKL